MLEKEQAVLDCQNVNVSLQSEVKDLRDKNEVLNAKLTALEKFSEELQTNYDMLE